MKNLKEGLTDRVKNQFRSLSGRLSPENLACDGEISAAQVNVRKRQIQKEWAELELKAGVKVTMDDIFNWYWNK